MKPISILAIGFYLLACGDSPPPEPIDKWVCTWQVASGVYFYHLSAEEYSATRRMIILK